jgi:hypothetical protein
VRTGTVKVTAWRGTKLAVDTRAACIAFASIARPSHSPLKFLTTPLANTWQAGDS